MEKQEKSWKEKAVSLYENWQKEIKEIINNHYPFTNNFMGWDKKLELSKKIGKFEYLKRYLEEAKKREVEENVWKRIYNTFSDFPSHWVYMLSKEEEEKWNSIKNCPTSPNI